MPSRIFLIDRLAIVICFALFILAACAPSITSTPIIATASPAPTDIWFALQERTPYPYATPLPIAQSTSIDGTYVNEEPIEGASIHCRRCPDYASDGGVWLLRFDKGIFRIHSRLTGWRSLGSYVVSGNRLTLFNDPTCTEDIGEYAWRVQDRKLVLIEIKDDCAIRLRANNLTKEAWASCQPPNVEAAITDHWNKPQGCP